MGGVAISPHARLTGLVMALDVLQQLALQVRGRCENSARHAVPFGAGKLALDLIGPAAVRRREVKRDVRMRGAPRLHRLRLVCRQVVDDPVQMLPLRGRCDDLIEERDRHSCGAPLPSARRAPCRPRGSHTGTARRAAPTQSRVVRRGLPSPGGPGWSDPAHGSRSCHQHRTSRHSWAATQKVR